MYSVGGVVPQGMTTVCISRSVSQQTSRSGISHPIAMPKQGLLHTGRGSRCSMQSVRRMCEGVMDGPPTHSVTASWCDVQCSAVTHVGDVLRMVGRSAHSTRLTSLRLESVVKGPEDLEDQRACGPVDPSDQRTFGPVDHSDQRTFGPVDPSDQRTFGPVNQLDQRTCLFNHQYTVDWLASSRST